MGIFLLWGHYAPIKTALKSNKKLVWYQMLTAFQFICGMNNIHI